MSEQNGNVSDPAKPHSNPLNPDERLEPSTADETTKQANPQADILPGDSELTKAEKVERHGEDSNANGDFEEPTAKRRKLDTETAAEPTDEEQPGRKKGVAPIKKEFLVDVSRTAQPSAPSHDDDDAAEASGKNGDEQAVGGRGAGDGKEKKRGQNKARQFGSSKDEIELCKARSNVNELDENTCRFGEKCKFEHDIRRYLKDGKREDLQTFNGLCPIWELKGKCAAGWRCRFAGGHSKEVEREDGRKELVLINKETPAASNGQAQGHEEEGVGVVNVVSNQQKIELRKKKVNTAKSQKYIQWLEKQYNDGGRNGSSRKQREDEQAGGEVDGEADGAKHDNRAGYVEPPLRPSEKRRLYYGPETPVVAPLTTQGNLPFRRLCVSLGAQVTWSEMAMGLPLLQGEKGEWALMKAHESETTPPAYRPKNTVLDYDNSRDLKFGAQIAAGKPWLALKTTEVLTALCPSLRAVDLNCGCPIDLVCRQGAGSNMLDTPGKLEKTLRGMNVVSGETPITVKIRMGTKDKKPTADNLVQRLVTGGPEAQEYNEGPAGVACITLHGRSKQQRYTRSADWSYIASCASLINNLKTHHADLIDTAREPDARDLAPASGQAGPGLPYFCGNGDVLSHVDYNTHLDHAGVDSCMIGRGALIKPWIFEEIAQNQYLDKSAEERLRYIEQFVRNGLEYWGSDEIGVGTTRRFLLEWLSFSCRYVPTGILEYLPPRFGDRPPAFRGRSELETLLSSANYKDWIKIR